MRSAIRSGLSAAHDAFRTQLWPIPVTGVVLAVVLGLLIPAFDVRADGHLPGFLDGLVFNGDPGASRTVLDAVASSLITVTSLTFSLTVVTLQLASSQFSPRLLRTFTQDVFVQVTLALFLATFTYSLTVLRSVRSSAEGADVSFVPRIAITVSFLLALASVVGLVLFLAHLTRQIRVETMLRNVHEDASDTIAANLMLRDDEDVPAIPDRPIHATIVFADDAGFLMRIDQAALLKLAAELDAVIAIDRHTGDFLVSGTPVAAFWRRGGGVLTVRDDVDKLRALIRRALHTGTERTAAQDVGYGLRQLTDVVAKALSPGINDPTTAVHALGHTSAMLVELMDRDLGTVALASDDGQPRLVLTRPTFEDYLRLAVTQPRRYGSSDPDVMASLYRLFEDLAWNAPVEYREAIGVEVARLRATVAGEDFDEVESGLLAGLDRRVLDVLSRTTGDRMDGPA